MIPAGSNNRLGRIEERKVGSNTVRFGYDKNDNITEITDPFNFSVDYAYNSLNRLETVTAGAKDFIYEYYADGMIKTLYYPGCSPQVPNVGLKTEYTYDNMNRLKTLQNKKNNQIISSFTYNYDNNGNITAVTSGGATTAYEYDALNRLKTTIKADGSRISYKYDSMGNRISISSNITGTADVNTKALDYNEWNELSSVTTNGGAYNYIYDPEKLRTLKTAPNGAAARYHTDYNGKVIAESDANNAVTAQNIWGLDKPLARKIGSAYYYYIYNGHGDVIALADESGTLVNSYDYDEWGNITSIQEQVANPIKYTGEYYDNESGYYYLRARYYDPSTGRFISKDPIEGNVNNPLSYNLYTYCMNNPMLYIDPSGCKGVKLIDTLKKNSKGQIVGIKDKYIDTRVSKELIPYINPVLLQYENLGKTLGYFPSYHYPGYTNLNFTASFGIGVSAGIMTDNTGEHFYIGPSVGLGASMSSTTSANSMSTGLNFDVSGTGFFTYTKSVDLYHYTHSTATESGGGAGFGAGASLYWVF